MDIWGVHKSRYPPKLRENLTNIDDLGVPPCMETTIYFSIAGTVDIFLVITTLQRNHCSYFHVLILLGCSTLSNSILLSCFK